MNTSKRNPKAIAKPTADELAGIPISDEIPVTKNTARRPTPRNHPTADDLAGIPITFEDMERKAPVHSRKKTQGR
jgi:hypothetical protein